MNAEKIISALIDLWAEEHTGEQIRVVTGGKEMPPVVSGNREQERKYQR